MQPAAKDDDIAFNVLAWAFGGQRRMTHDQHQQVRQAIRDSRFENFESQGRRKNRYRGLGPAWARLTRSGPEMEET